MGVINCGFPLCGSIEYLCCVECKTFNKCIMVCNVAKLVENKNMIERVCSYHKKRVKNENI